MNLGIVILNWNGKSFLEKFLPSVVSNSEGAELWVIDNASTDDSVSFLEQSYPQIKIVRNKMNGGFAKGYNDGLASICADIYVLLNSDIEVTPGWLEPVCELLDKNPEIAACQPAQVAHSSDATFSASAAAE